MKPSTILRKAGWLSSSAAGTRVAAWRSVGPVWQGADTDLIVPQHCSTLPNGEKISETEIEIGSLEKKKKPQKCHSSFQFIVNDMNPGIEYWKLD